MMQRLPRLKKKIVPYALLFPTFLILGYILIYPALRNCFLSLWKWKLTSADERVFVGLENYIRILTNDSTFTTVIGFTFRFAFISLAVEMVLGLLIALLLNQEIHGRSLIASLYIMPYSMASIAVGLCWRLMWAEDYGLINYLVGRFSARGWRAMPFPDIGSGFAFRCSW